LVSDEFDIESFSPEEKNRATNPQTVKLQISNRSSAEAPAKADQASNFKPQMTAKKRGPPKGGPHEN